ncbi:glycoside hydrolase family 113 [Sporolactobacillus pectinivorans]|uniref:glycoside hydrolase family 113 n=1 Tax=Sporolactobacillus pectinivorans TaxID=1591408 RepID=UPI000C26472E|nr:hypothetical protein [Sporolactobacillus pectinivorans]
MWKIILIIVLSAILILSGCSLTNKSREKHRITGTKPLNVPSTAVVASPWKKNTFQKGIQIYLHVDGMADSLIRQRINQNLDYIVKLGANAVGISFPIYTDGVTPTHVYASQATPSQGQLTYALMEAKKRQLRVMLRPIIDETNIVKEQPIAWRGSIEPKNTEQWFQSYDELIEKYAKIAKRFKVDELVVGSELTSLQPQIMEWNTLKAKIWATGFRGTLSYATNWDNFPSMPFEPGIDAYPRVHLNDQATISQLTQALYDWLIQQPFAVRRKLTIQETGIAAQSGMYHKPFVWDSKAPVNASVQANWFQAIYKAAKEAHLCGIYYWTLDIRQDPEQELETGTGNFSFVRKSTEAVIRSNFNH